MKLKFLAALALSAATLCSCDDETTGIGQFVADDDFACGRSVFTDDDRKAGLRGKADAGQQRADAYSKSGLFHRRAP